MRRFISILVITFFLCIAAAESPGVLFNQAKATTKLVNDREANFPLASSRVNGKDYFLFLLHGGKVIDVGTKTLLTVAPGGLKSQRGNYLVDMTGLTPLEGGSVTIEPDGAEVRVSAAWQGNKVFFALVSEAGAVPEPEPEVTQVSSPVPMIPAVEPVKVTLPQLTEPQLLSDGVFIRYSEKFKVTSPPRVRVLENIQSTLPGYSLLGPVYRVEGTKGAAVPVELFFPLPDLEPGQDRRLVVLRMDGPSTTVVPIHTLDAENRRLSVWTTGFSDWGIAAASENDTATALIRGNVSYEDGYDETPGYIEIHLECNQTRSGEPATFLIAASGPGPCALNTPIPESLFGLYSIKYVVGYSSSHFYAGVPPLTVADISSGGTYQFDVEVVPITASIKGFVRDGDGNPLENVRVELESPDGNTYYTTTLSGGRYIIDIIGLGGTPARKKSVNVPYTLINQDEEECNTSGGNLELKAGINVIQDFVLQPEGTVYGNAADEEGDPHKNAPVDVLAEGGGRLETRTDGDGNYRIEHVPAGKALVTVHCPDPDSKVQESKDVEVDCEEESRLDFTFKCCDAELELFVEDQDGLPVEGASVKLVDVDNQVFTALTDDLGSCEITDCSEGPARLEVTCPDGEDKITKTVELDCKELTQDTVVLKCCQKMNLTGNIEVKRGMPGAMLARLDGTFTLSSTTACKLSGKGKGQFAMEVAGSDGSCTGKQDIMLEATGRREGKFLVLDITFDDQGVPMAWKCGQGKAVPIPEAFKSFEDEGTGLRIPIVSGDSDRIRAELEQGGGPSPFGTTMKINIHED